jgi:alkylation response protein AidB-like acyl-CoA dehydrogenase
MDLVAGRVLAVDVELTEDQELFVQTTVRFIEATYPLDAVRENAGGGAGPDDSYRKQAADLGWFAMLVPESLGGGSVSDNGVLDCALIAYARGALLQPSAFVDTNIVAYAIAQAGSAEQRTGLLPALISGAQSASWAASALGADASPTAGVSAIDRDGTWVLSGVKTLVHDADRSDWLLVTADSPGGPRQFLIERDTPGVSVRVLNGLDITRCFCQVRFEDTAVPSSARLGPAEGSADLIDRQLQIACVLVAAESSGAMDHDMTMAVQYAKDRIAFGRPIGSFQAVKHLLADTSLMLEMSKATVQAAALAVGSNDDDSDVVASVAKAFVGDCGVDLAQNCFQVFGGIGYTWEHDQHLYLRRLSTDAALFGNASWHRERICRLGRV